ncbi:MAG: NupC/NupG family nucleoside CNT transporter [Candidatus Eremiobacteraeota bacterium]|nr:NupC/NupG family nucleoside CNT transporter [Candidatus Eremiobacteraeota bacterium]MCW5866347.1 NupC/NupG family nucleoside CNT transporter [Candidatus Eremiobacteraeota bacterium]
MERAVGLLGILVFLGLAVAFSRNRKAIDWRLVASSLGIQVALAVLLLKTKPGLLFFESVGHLVHGLMETSQEGIKFVFGSLSNPGGEWGFIFAIRVLPTIIFFASLVNVLFYLGVMQWVVSIISKAMRFVLRTSGAETLCASANIFIGQSESPLLILPYVAGLTQSELMVVMASGFATMSAGVMIVYAGMLTPLLGSAAGHILTACVLSAPASIMMAKILIPETEKSETSGDVKIDLPRTESNVIEAAAAGAGTGLHLCLNVGAMLIAFISLIALINSFLGFIPIPESMQAGVGARVFSLELILGWIFAPFAWLIGMAGKDSVLVGSLLGQSLVINEFVAYSQLQVQMAAGKLDPRSAVLAIYALAGFTNLSSIAIQIGGIGAMAEKRKGDLARLGFIALFAGVLTNLHTAALAGLLLGDEQFKAQPAITTTPTASATPVPTTETPAPSDDQ